MTIYVPGIKCLLLYPSMVFVGRVWRVGRVDAFRPKGHMFDFRSNRHEGTLWNSFTLSCLRRFGM